jgi:hypothetical protein
MTHNRMHTIKVVKTLTNIQNLYIHGTDRLGRELISTHHCNKHFLESETEFDRQGLQIKFIRAVNAEKQCS